MSSPQYPLQKLPNSDKFGIYHQILNTNQTTISAGDIIRIEHFISGYGLIDIRTAKIFYSSSGDIIDKSGSFVTSGYGIKEKEDNTQSLGWYGEKNPIPDGGVLELEGHVSYEDKHFTLFDDVKSRKMIMTEGTTGSDPNDQSVPILWQLKTNNKVKPGKYLVSYTLTYFNGDSWQANKVELPITIMTWYEKYANWVQWIAMLIAILSIISLTISIPKEIYKLFSDGDTKINQEVKQKKDKTIKPSLTIKKIDSIKKTVKD